MTVWGSKTTREASMANVACKRGEAYSGAGRGPIVGKLRWTQRRGRRQSGEGFVGAPMAFAASEYSHTGAVQVTPSSTQPLGHPVVPEAYWHTGPGTASSQLRCEMTARFWETSAPWHASWTS